MKNMEDLFIEVVPLKILDLEHWIRIAEVYYFIRHDNVHANSCGVSATKPIRLIGNKCFNKKSPINED